MQLSKKIISRYNFHDFTHNIGMKKHKDKKVEEVDFLKEDVVSMTECTGLMPTPPKNSAEEKALKDIYDIP